MPAQPSVRGQDEEEMEAEGESHLPEANGEVEELRDHEDGGEESMEERDSDLEESEEEEEEDEEEEESSGRKQSFL